MPEQRNFDVETVKSSSPATVAHALKGVEFPQDKEGLVEYAEQHGAREDVVERIAMMPEAEYNSMADVFKGVGEANEGEEEEYEAGEEEEEEEEVEFESDDEDEE